MRALVQNKKGLSIIIGYILLVAISIVMSILVYQWLKTYVPKDALKCSEGTSFFLKDYSYNCEDGILSITLKNNGRFGINGFFIRVSSESDSEKLPTIDLSSNIESGGKNILNSVVYSDSVVNFLSPSEPKNVQTSVFDVSDFERIYGVELVPTRVQSFDGKTRTVSCNEAKIRESITCD